MHRRVYIRLLFVAVVLALFLAGTQGQARTQREKATTPKLVQMYQYFYLPFSLTFLEGTNRAEVLPFIQQGPSSRLIRAEELKRINTVWASKREAWRAKSLLLRTPVALNSSVKISKRLRSHKIALNRRALDGVSLQDRMKVQQTLKRYPEKVKKAFKQLRFLKSFLRPGDDKKFNLFVIGPHWCRSTREYQMLLESYVKRFRGMDLRLHSVAVYDPKEAIFNSGLVKELLPDPKLHKNNNVPLFLALDLSKGRDAVVYEEGDALRMAFERFFGKHHGFLNNQVGIASSKKKKNLRSLRKLSSVGSK